MKQSATLDSSFWINAHRSGLASRVLARFDISFGPAVGRELSHKFASGREFWRLVEQGVLKEQPPSVEVVTDFGPGEGDALNLALAHSDWVLLMDDRRPLQAAQRMGLRAICTPVLVVDLYAREELSLAEALASLARLSVLRTLSPVLIEAAIAQLVLMREGEQHGDE